MVHIINERFDKKYEDYLRGLNKGIDFIEALQIWEKILYSDDFTTNDFFDLLDFIDGKKDNPLQLNALSETRFVFFSIILGKEFEYFYLEWDKHTIRKYADLFLGIQCMLSLIELPESVIEYYKDDFDWNIIFANTWLVEPDRVDQRATDLTLEYLDYMEEDLWIEVNKVIEELKKKYK